MMEVGGFFFEFEAVRTVSSEYDAPRRSGQFRRAGVVPQYIICRSGALMCGGRRRDVVSAHGRALPGLVPFYTYVSDSITTIVGVRFTFTVPCCRDDVFHSHICRRVLRGQGFRSSAVDRGLDGGDAGGLRHSFVFIRAHVPRRSRAEMSISIGEMRLRVLRRGRTGLFIRDVPAIM